MKNTLKLLLGLKLAFSLGRIADSMGLVGRHADSASGKVGKLKRGLLGINEITIAAITIPIVYEITTKIIGKIPGLPKFLTNTGKDLFDKLNPGAGKTGSNGQFVTTGKVVQDAIKFARAWLDAGNSVKQVTADMKASTEFGGLTASEIKTIISIAEQAKQRLGVDGADRRSRGACN